MEMSGAERTFWKVHLEKQGTHFKRRGITLVKGRKCSKKILGPRCAWPGTGGLSQGPVTDFLERERGTQESADGEREGGMAEAACLSCGPGEGLLLRASAPSTEAAADTH